MNTSILDLETMQTTAVFDENGFLHATQPLPGKGGETVQIVVIRVRDETFDAGEVDEKAWHRGIVSNPAFAFLKDATEDIYSWEDGEPLPPLRAGVKSP